MSRYRKYAETSSSKQVSSSVAVGKMRIASKRVADVSHRVGNNYYCCHSLTSSHEPRGLPVAGPALEALPHSLREDDLRLGSRLWRFLPAHNEL